MIGFSFKLLIDIKCMTRLSILVPAFNYSKGIERILRVLTPLPPSVELIVADDSTDSSVKDIIEKFPEKNVIYLKNIPAKGAVRNWNYLIDNATGEYIILLHHDELPLTQDFLNLLLKVLSKTSKDVLMMDVILLNESLTPIRAHIPRKLRHFILRYAPGYLFCRNIIGPTASLVIRKKYFSAFDASLKWFVDVEFYHRLLQATKAWTSLQG